MPKFVFFSDLDGTLLDRNTYSFAEAGEALLRIKETKSALVFCSSKTKAELLEYEKIFGQNEPFIAENGGAVFIPNGYFLHAIENAEKDGKHLVLKLGVDAEELEVVVDALAEKMEVLPMHRMTAKEFAEDTGLTLKRAEKALDRHFTASFKVPGEEQLEEARRFVEEKGYTLTVGGRYCAVMKGSDKGKAVKILAVHYKEEFDKIVTVGLGDSPSDFPMLEACDRAFLVAKKDGSYSSQEFEKVEGIGPKGWNRAVLEVLK